MTLTIVYAILYQQSEIHIFGGVAEMDKKMSLLTFCHGEYDDYSEMPLMTFPDKDTAYLILEAIKNREQPYLDMARKAFNDDTFFESYINDSTFGMNVYELPFVSLN